MTEQNLYKELAGSIGAGESKIVPRIIEMMANEKAARVVLAASPPGTLEELSEKTGYAGEDVQKALDDMFQKGLIYKSRKKEAIRYYRFRNILQFHDANIVTPGLSKEVLDLWREFDDKEWPATFKVIEEMLPAPGGRVIPVNESVSSEAQIMPFDDIGKLVESAHRIAVVQCTCRLVAGECGLPLENCIQLNKAADYTVERGTGREITKKETLAILEEARQVGLVHVVDNRRSSGNILCNCCADCCINWPDPKNYRQLFTAPSRYTAVVEADACTACEECPDRCHFDAIFMNEDGDLALVNEDKCMGCGLCQVTCEGEAITLVEKRAVEFVPE
ncbi:MAG: 4Fe-4S ferredoxin [Proteobacteria bacterium]|nr:4Fe-4S ferredoxin [Pseudomonadota bacterium]